MAAKRLPLWVWDVIYYAALLGALVSVATRDWAFVTINAVVALGALHEQRRKVV